MKDWLPFAAGALIVAGIWGHGYSAGHSARDAVAVSEASAAARQAAIRNAQIEARARQAEVARLQIERERDALQARLDNESRADPDAGRRALGADSMRRIGATGQ